MCSPACVEFAFDFCKVATLMLVFLVHVVEHLVTKMFVRYKPKAWVVN